MNLTGIYDKLNDAELDALMYSWRYFHEIIYRAQIPFLSARKATRCISSMIDALEGNSIHANYKVQLKELESKLVDYLMVEPDEID